jgi:hypothetical protein
VKALSVVVEVFYYPLLMQEPQLATTTASTTTTTPTSPPASAGGCRASTELQQQMRQTGGRVATIFSVAEKLLFAHRTFCAILNERLRNLDEFRHKGLGDIFLKKTRTPPHIRVCVACGVWRVACGVWRVACGVCGRVRSCVCVVCGRVCRSNEELMMGE